MFHIVVNTIEDDVINIRDKEGWITRNEFIKYAMDTDLCKTEIQDRVFSQPVWSNSDSEPKKKSKDASKKDSRKVRKSLKNALIFIISKLLIFYHWNNLWHNDRPINLM